MSVYDMMIDVKQDSLEVLIKVKHYLNLINANGHEK